MPNLEAGRHHKIYRFSELYSELYPSISFGDKLFDHDYLLFLIGVMFLEVFTSYNFIESFRLDTTLVTSTLQSKKKRIKDIPLYKKKPTMNLLLNSYTRLVAI